MIVDRLFQHIARMAVPIGTMLDYGGSTVPKGYLACDGTAVSRTTYSALFAAIGTTWGTGDGSTTFNTPSLSGRATIGSGTGTLAETIAEASWTNSGGDLAAAVTANDTTWITGMAVVPTSTDTLPTGLTNPAYVVRVSSTSLKFATSLANAVAGTVIAFTNDGTGNHTITHTLTARTLGQKLGEETHALTTAQLPVHAHSYLSPSGGGGAVGGADVGSQTTSTGNAGSSTAHNVMPPAAVVTKIIRAL